MRTLNTELVSEKVQYKDKTGYMMKSGISSTSFVDFSDQELMQLINESNSGAWSELIHRYAGLVYSIGYQVLKNESDAEDASQNTFVRIKQYASSYKPELPLKPWLAQIASGEAIRLYKRKKNINEKESERMEAYDLKGNSNNDVSQSIEKQELESLIRRAIELLPELSRMAITLYYVGGLSQTEIAKQLGVSQFSISEKINTGLEKIKIHLKKAGIVSPVVMTPALLQKILIDTNVPAGLIQKIVLASKSKVSSVFATKASSKKIIFGFSFNKVMLVSSIVIIILSIMLVIKNKNIDTKKQPLKQIAIFQPNSLNDLQNSAIDIKEKPFVVSIDNMESVKVNLREIPSDAGVPDIFEGDYYVKADEPSYWKVITDKNQNAILERKSDKKFLDGFYFKTSFETAFVFSGKIYPKADRCKTGFLMSSVLDQDSMEKIKNVIDDKNQMTYVRQTRKISFLIADKGNEIDFKIYILPINNNLYSFSFVKCKGYPLNLVINSMPINIMNYRFGVLSNSNLEIANFSAKPIDSKWNYLNDIYFKEKMNELPKELKKAIDDIYNK